MPAAASVVLPDPADSRSPVAVIGTLDADRNRIVAVLGANGRDSLEFEMSREFDRSGVETDAVVLCHRADTDLVPVPRLPTRLRGLRVVVVSDRDDEAHVVEALASGVHHVFRIGESDRVLRARLGAALRRHGARRQPIMTVSPFRFDLSRHSVSRDAVLLGLKPREFDFAHYMFAHRGRLVTNAELLTSVWSLPQTVDTRRIDTAACRVRKKMQLDDRTGWVLRRFRREGYGLYGDSRSTERTPPETERRVVESLEED